MFDVVNNTITSYNMFDNIETVTVGLSGGADSMSLLYFLFNNAEYYGIKVAAAHVNHCLRGEESERDCSFVVEQCRKLGIPLFIKKADIAALAEQRKIGLEQCGREERYAFFEELANDEKTVIATAHTASDNAETVLLNITRGCGLDGLKGIPPVRGKIIRPLINVTRQQIEKYCRENDIPYVTDSSNLVDDYSRNKIRLTVIPDLREINPSVTEAINRLSDIVSKDLKFIDGFVIKEYNKCVDEFGLSISKLKKVDRNILPRLIKYSVSKNLNITPEKKHIELIKKIIDLGQGAVMPGKNSTVRVKGNSLIFIKETERETAKYLPFGDTRIKLGETYHYLGKKYCFSDKIPKINYYGDKINKKLLNQRISYDIIPCDVVLRNRRSGDIFRPAGRNCTKTLKKLFTELKIPVDERDKLLVLAVGNNVLWIENIGLSQDAVLTDTSDYFFTIEVRYDK